MLSHGLSNYQMKFIQTAIHAPPFEEFEFLDPLFLEIILAAYPHGSITLISGPERYNRCANSRNLQRWAFTAALSLVSFWDLFHKNALGWRLCHRIVQSLILDINE
jgi:hypothetical protein